MPGGDRRGPVGEGPLTGRQRGYCAGYDRAGFERPGRGGGYGGGRGANGSRGAGRGYGRVRDFEDNARRGEGFDFGSILSEIRDGLNSLMARVSKLESREK